MLQLETKIMQLKIIILSILNSQKEYYLNNSNFFKLKKKV